jgi:transposase-like protein
MIDFLLSETRDLTSARRFFQKALAAPGHPRPRVINVDGSEVPRRKSHSCPRTSMDEVRQGPRETRVLKTAAHSRV